MAGHPAEFAPDTDQRSVLHLVLRALVVRIDIKSVSEGATCKILFQVLYGL